MANITVYGFPHSSFVHIVQLVLNHKEVPYTFHDLERAMGSSKHLALHPFDRVPILQHGDFVLYETSAIVAYLEELFPTPSLQTKYDTRPGADEPVDQRGEFLLLPVYDLSCWAR